MRAGGKIDLWKDWASSSNQAENSEKKEEESENSSSKKKGGFRKMKMRVLGEYMRCKYTTTAVCNDVTLLLIIPCFFDGQI